MNLRRAFDAGFLAAFAACVAFSALAAQAQDTQGPIAPKPGTAVQRPPDGAIRVRVALVNVPVAVTDGKGNLLLGLDKKDFKVLDNGTEQTIESFDLGGEPLSVVLVFETSSHIAPLIPAIQKSAIVFTQTVVGQSGEASVVGYSDTVDQLLPFTTDNDKIENAIANLKIGTSGMRLYSALSTAVRLLQDRPITRRRVIIVVGESQDSGSEQRLGEVLRDAQLSNVVIYSVGLSTAAAALRSQSQPKSVQSTPPGTFGLPPVPGMPQTPSSDQQQRYGSAQVDVLALAEWTVQHVKAVVKDRPFEVATAATGGLNQSTFRDHSIENAIDAIGGELNSQYTLSYHPTDSDILGYHHITVTVNRMGTKVRTRPGYYLAEN
jgi:VWFA-related protein